MRDKEQYYKDWDDYCWFSNPKNGFPLMSIKEYDEYCQRLQYEDEHEAEQYAENAWLRKAEQGIDDGFDEWERSRGCYLQEIPKNGDKNI